MSSWLSGSFLALFGSMELISGKIRIGLADGCSSIPVYLVPQSPSRAWEHNGSHEITMLF